jgi:hypothetical protein
MHDYLLLRKDSLGQWVLQDFALLFPMINDLEKLKLPQSIRPPSRSSNFASCLSRWGEELEILGNTYGSSEGQSFEEMSNKSALTVTRADV